MDWLRLAFFSPLIAAPVCALIFWLAVPRFSLSAGKAMDELAGHLFFWLVLGFLVGVALPIILALVGPSGEAIFMILISVPLGLSVGALAATLAWRIHAGEA